MSLTTTYNEHESDFKMNELDMTIEGPSSFHTGEMLLRLTIG